MLAWTCCVVCAWCVHGDCMACAGEGGHAPRAQLQPRPLDHASAVDHVQPCPPRPCSNGRPHAAMLRWSTTCSLAAVVDHMRPCSDDHALTPVSA
eukprot:361612-Chlamydomonas_euryale.AAC.16